MNDTVPDGWSIYRQGDICEFSNGRAYKLTEWEKEGIPVIRLQNLTGSGKDFYYSNLELPERQYCTQGDLLYMWSATFGPHIWKGQKAIYHYHIWKVTPDEKNLTKSYSYQLLGYKTDEWINTSNGMGILHVTKGGMEDLPLTIPPLPEQKKIAAILTSVDEVIEKTQVQINKLKDLKTGMMQDLLIKGIGHKEFKDSPVGRIPAGWEVKPLGEIAEINPRLKNKPDAGSSVSFITMADVSIDARLIRKSERPYKEVSKGFTHFKNGDVLFAKITPCMENGKGAHVHELTNGIGFGSTEFHTIRAPNAESARIIHQLVSSKQFREKAAGFMTGSAGQRRVPTEFLKEILIPFPSDIEEIKKIASTLESIDQRVDIQSQSLQTKKELKKALMQDLLTGKVRVNMDS